MSEVFTYVASHPILAVVMVFWFVWLGVWIGRAWGRAHPYISAVQDGDRRIEYGPPAVKNRNGVAGG